MALGDHKGALEESRREVALFRKRGWLLGSRTAAEFENELVEARQFYDNHLQLVATLAQLGDVDGATAAAEAFKTAQLASPSRTSEALQIVNEALDAADPTLTQLRLDFNRTALSINERREAMLDLIRRPESRRDHDLEKYERAQLSNLESEASAFEARLSKLAGGTATKFAEPVSAAEAKAKLHSGEALLMYSTNDARTVAWVIRGDAAPVMVPLAIAKVYEMAIVLERETVDGRPPANSPPGTHGPRAVQF